MIMVLLELKLSVYHQLIRSVHKVLFDGAMTEMGVIEPWSRLPRVFVGSPLLDIYKTQLDMFLGKL